MHHIVDQLNNCNNIDDYFKENRDFLVNTGISDYLYDIFKEKCLVKSQVLKKAEVDEIYGYQIFSGRKNPSRNTLIAICIGARFTLNEIQTALKIAGYATLYAKNKRDSLIIWGINNSKSVIEINEMLFNENEDTLN